MSKSESNAASVDGGGEARCLAAQRETIEACARIADFYGTAGVAKSIRALLPNATLRAPEDTAIKPDAGSDAGSGGEAIGWKCNNCQTIFTSTQQQRKPDDSNGGPRCPYCKADGQYTYPYGLHDGDPCNHCGIAHDEVPPGPCGTAPSPDTGKPDAGDGGVERLRALEAEATRGPWQICEPGEDGTYWIDAMDGEQPVAMIASGSPHNRDRDDAQFIVACVAFARAALSGDRA